MTVVNSGAVVARVPPSWDETFMQLARVYDERSKDPGTQVGAVIAGADYRQLSAGYNGEPRGSPGTMICRGHARASAASWTRSTRMLFTLRRTRC